MTINELPFRATTEQACEWLGRQTNTPWTLTHLIENGLIPIVWLDYAPDYPELFDDANGGYPAPIFLEADTRRLAAGSDDVLITMTKDVYKIVAQLKPPGIRRALHELRFPKKDLERLASKLKRAAQPQPVKIAQAKESQAGINKEQVLIAFSGLVKINLEQVLSAGGGIFGDDGARVKGSAKRGAKSTVWNPITLALGLNDVYRVPMPQLKRAFKAYDFLDEWNAQWDHTLALLGK